MISAVKYMAYSTARRLGMDEQGATATEYVFLLVFIAIAIIVAATFLGDSLESKFNEAGNAVGGAPANTSGS